MRAVHKISFCRYFSVQNCVHCTSCTLLPGTKFVHCSSGKIQILYTVLQHSNNISILSVQSRYCRDSHPNQGCTKCVQPGKYHWSTLLHKHVVKLSCPRFYHSNCDIFEKLSYQKIFILQHSFDVFWVRKIPFTRTPSRVPRRIFKIFPQLGQTFI